MVDCPMSFDPRDDELLQVMLGRVDVAGWNRRVYAGYLARFCAMSPPEIGARLVLWAGAGVVLHGRSGWRFTPNGLALMRRHQERAGVS